MAEENILSAGCSWYRMVFIALHPSCAPRLLRRGGGVRSFAEIPPYHFATFFFFFYTAKHELRN